MDKDFNINGPSSLYHVLDNILRGIISEHFRIGRDILHVFILGLVDNDKDKDSGVKMMEIQTIWDCVYNNDYIDIHVLNEFGNEYVKFLDYIYDTILDKFGIKNIIKVFNYLSYITKHKDYYRIVYLSYIKNIIEDVCNEFKFESMCMNTYHNMMSSIQEKLISMRKSEHWLNGFNWIIELSNQRNDKTCNHIHMEFSDYIGGKDKCDIIFDINDNSLIVTWDCLED